MDWKDSIFRYSMHESPPDAFQSPPCDTKFHKTVQEAFREVLRRSFKPIPDCPDYYYYSPPLEFEEPVSVSGCGFGTVWMVIRIELFQEGDSFSPASQDFDDQQAVVTFCLEDTASRSVRVPQPARASAGTVSTVTRRTRTTTSFSSADDGESSSCDSLSALVSEAWRTPVFLHLACSVRLRGILYSCSIQDLPVCLGKRLRMLEGGGWDGMVFLVTLFRDCDFDAWDDEELWTQLDVRLDLMALTPQRIEEEEIFSTAENDWWGENEETDTGR